MGLTLLLDELDEASGKDKSKPFAEPESAPTVESRSNLLDTEVVASWRSLARDIFSNAQTSVDVLNDLLNYDK